MTEQDKQMSLIERAIEKASRKQTLDERSKAPNILGNAPEQSLKNSPDAAPQKEPVSADSERIAAQGTSRLSPSAEQLYLAQVESLEKAALEKAAPVRPDAILNTTDGNRPERKADQAQKGEQASSGIGIGKAKASQAERELLPEQTIDLAALKEAGYLIPDMPPSLLSEEFRLIKRGLLLNAFGRNKTKGRNGNIILITSSNPSEGKTFFSINLALSIASERDVTVLLVDADFPKPEILHRLGVAGGKGLMDVVADESLDIGDCLLRTNIPNLVLLPAGRAHNLTTELLASDRMAKIMEEIAGRYPDRLVLFDSPPVLASSAASVMALNVGQTVFVVEAEKTTEPQIKESLNTISACPNISMVLNKIRFNESHKKFASYYGYGGR